MSNPTFSEANQAIDTVRKYLTTISPTERTLLIDEIMEGYCKECGCDSDGVCHCTNDE